MKNMSYQELLRDAQAFYDECCEALQQRNSAKSRRCSTASILLSFIAIESFINNMMLDFASLPKGLFSIHERGFLEEREVRLVSSGKKAGEFKITKMHQYRRLEDKILFLIAKFSKDSKVDKGASLWQRFERSKDIRDGLSHPRRNGLTVPSQEDSKVALQVAREIIELVSEKVWGQKVDL